MGDTTTRDTRSWPIQQLGVALVFLAILANILWFGAIGWGGWRLLSLIAAQS